MKVVPNKQVGAEGAGETEGARRATGVFPAGAPAAEPAAVSGTDTEVVARPQRRRFTAEYKRRIVREAESYTYDQLSSVTTKNEALSTGDVSNVSVTYQITTE